MNIFKCTNCGKLLNGFIPSKCECGFTVPIINGVYQFTDDAPISVDVDGLKWLGYEKVGENYEPGYVYDKDNDNIGNSDKLAGYIGKDKIVLDLGAGLGIASISCALAGLNVIAADISQVMLETAVKRAQKHNVPDDKVIFARMNGYKLELADKSVDAIIAMDVLKQVDRPELMVAEIKRVLKSDGYFLQYGGRRGLEYTAEQEAANARYAEIYKDIESFYDNLINKTGYGDRPVADWEKEEECIKENFIEHILLENTGWYGAINIKWSLKLGLHKIKTRASGVKSLIPDDIHNNAWAKTDKYAKNKYGENYEDIFRYLSGENCNTILYTIR